MLSAIGPLTTTWTRPHRASARAAETPAPGEADSAVIGPAPPPPSRAMTWTGRLTALGLALCLGAYVAGVAVEATHPIVPHPEQVTAQQLEDYSLQCAGKNNQSLSTDAAQNERLQRIGKTLEPYQSHPYTWTLVDNHMINAYSCGNGRILIEQKLAERLDDRELRFVMAHEQGHDELGHQKETLSYLDQGSWRLNIPVYNIDPRAGYALFARGHELAGDCYAVRVTGDAAAGMSALQKTNPQGGGGASHPGNSARDQNMRACAPETLQPGPA